MNTSTADGQAVSRRFQQTASLGLAATGNAGQVTSLMDLLGASGGQHRRNERFRLPAGRGLLLFTGIGSWRIVFGRVPRRTHRRHLQPGGSRSTATSTCRRYVLHQLMGGFMFGLVFMAADPVTAAQTDTGKWIYGFFIGLLAISIRAW